MSYRDDVDTLYTRAMVLQRELDAAAEKLAQRDAELAQLRGTSFSREDTSPGIRLLRDLPDPDQVLSRLVSTSEREQKAIDEVENAPFLSDDKVKEILPEPPPHPRLSRIPSMPDWSAYVRVPPVLDRLRDIVAKLSTDDMVLIEQIVDQLTDANTDDAKLRARLRWMLGELGVQSRG